MRAMKWVKAVFLVLLAIFIVMQFVKRPSYVNPPVDATKTIYAAAPVPQDVHAILDRSCNDCHSNTTRWPWYSRIAPVSWLVADDVEKGRKELNLSTWATSTPRRQAHKLEEMCDQVEEGEMPLPKYLYTHRDAKLSPADRTRLCEWANTLRAQIITTHPEAAGKGKGRGKG
jgi:hypothetical protein